MPVVTIAALVASAFALVLAGLALYGSKRRGDEVDALHDRMDEEGKQWRHLIHVVSQRVDDAYERASQPSMPGDASLRLQGATEAVEDLRRDLHAVQLLLKRESEQRLATEISLFKAIDGLRRPETPASPAAPPAGSGRRARRTDSLFEIVDFGSPPEPREE